MLPVALMPLDEGQYSLGVVPDDVLVMGVWSGGQVMGIISAKGEPLRPSPCP